jgi:peptide/nickel transport system substrate-binding protein
MRSTWFRTLRLLALGAALSAAVCGAARAAGDKDPATLRLLLWQAPTTLNPHFADGIKDQEASRITYEPLASFDRDGKMVPFLAAEVPTLENGEVAADGKSVTWKLRRDVKWSDGQPFTSKDVVFTYNFITNPDVKSTSGDSYKSVESVEALDDYTIKITFKKVNPAWAAPFVGVRGMIIPEHVFAPYNNAKAAEAPVNLAPVGTGPYIAKEFRKEDVLIIGEDTVNTVKIFYEPNPLYRDAGKLRCMEPAGRRQDAHGDGSQGGR